MTTSTADSECHSNEKFLTRKITNITYAIGVYYDIIPCTVYLHIESYRWYSYYGTCLRWFSKRLHTGQFIIYRVIHLSTLSLFQKLLMFLNISYIILKNFIKSINCLNKNIFFSTKTCDFNSSYQSKIFVGVLWRIKIEFWTSMIKSIYILDERSGMI